MLGLGLGFCDTHLVHFSIRACHPCAGAMLLFSVSFQFYRRIPFGLGFIGFRVGLLEFRVPRVWMRVSALRYCVQPAFYWGLVFSWWGPSLCASQGLDGLLKPCTVVDLIVFCSSFGSRALGPMVEKDVSEFKL